MAKKQLALTDKIVEIESDLASKARSINLYDNTIPLMAGYYSASSATFTISTEHQNTEKINIKGYNFVFIQCSQTLARVLVFFSENGTKIKPLESSGANYMVDEWGLHQVPEGALSVSILVKYSGIDARGDLMLEKGSIGQAEGSEYSPFGLNENATQPYVTKEIAKNKIEIQNELFLLESDLTRLHEDKIVDGFYAQNSTGAIVSLGSVSYITIPVIENTWIYFLVSEIPYTNISHPGVYKNDIGNYIGPFNGISNTEGIQMFKVPSGATKLLLNFQTIYFDRIKLTSDMEGFSPIIKSKFIKNININKLVQSELFNDVSENNVLGYFKSDGTIINMTGTTLGMTSPYSCSEGDVFKVLNYSSLEYPPASLSFKVVHFNAAMQFLNLANEISDPYEHTIPTGVSFVMFLIVKSQAALLSIKKTKTESNVKILRSSIYPEIPENVDTNPWQGVLWTSLGDSLTANDIWQPFVVTKLGLVHTNCGIGSTRLAGLDSNAFWQDARLDAVKASNPTIVTILGGANDITQDIDIGTDAEFEKTLLTKDKSNFKGAYSYIIENLLTWNPSLKVIILTTSYAHLGGGSYSPSGNMRYYMYANASREVANHYGIPVVDLYREQGVNKLTQTTYTSDNIHWNDAGAKIVASLVIECLEKIKPIADIV